MSFTFARREITLAGLAGTAVSLIPGKVLGANSMVNLACIGIGNRGAMVIDSMSQSGLANIVALCDVDIESRGPAKTGKQLGWNNKNHVPALTAAKFPTAKKFTDFRVMFDTMSDEIDAVLVCLPDHSHFPATMEAMALGKQVYVEKPMAHTFLEIELMMKAAEKYNVVTQMGNQGFSDNNYFQFKEWVETGIIKDVTHADAFMTSNRRWYGYGDVHQFPTGEKAPATLDWDGWLGTAQPHAYSAKLHYGNWRGWHDFGTGCFGDWGAHVLDSMHAFLNLGLPAEITAKSLTGQNDFLYPLSSIINFQFSARDRMPAMDIDWYDGVGNLPKPPEEFGTSRTTPTIGKFIYSKDRVFEGGHHGATLKILPLEEMKEMLKAGKINKKWEDHSDHYTNFLLACRGEEETRSPFSICGPLSQTLVLGCLAQRLGGTLKFDTKKKMITNNKVANQLLAGPPPRKEWREFYTI